MIDDAKPVLRQSFRQARRTFVTALSPDELSLLEGRLAAIAAPVTCGFAMPASFAAIGHELDPKRIDADFAATAFPRVDSGLMTFRRCRRDDLRPGFAGIPEPPADAPQVIPDLVLVPLVAVMPNGTRLGQGMGYYDRALAILCQHTAVRTIAIAWDVQIADTLPCDSWDIPVDFIATPTRLVDCAAVR